MPTPRPYRISDQYALYFLTFTVVNWVDIFTRKEIKDIFIDSLKYCQENKGLIVCCYVIMSNHVHLILQAEERSDGLSAIIRDLKKFTSKKIINWIQNNYAESRKDWMLPIFQDHGLNNTNNHKFQLWQQRYHAKLLSYPKFTYRVINYIHNNPVKAGIVDNAEHYKYSSARSYVGGYTNEEILLNVQCIDYGVQEGILIN